MGSRVQLGDRDRERLGCGEALDFDLMEISIADLEELSERFGFEPEDWPTPLIGEIPFEQAGSPDAKPVRPRWQTRAVVWLALHQSGHDATWDEAGKVAYNRVRFVNEEEPGKDETSPSPPSAGSGTPPSDTSSD